MAQVRSRLNALPRFGDGRRLRVGLLGGSFNPAHRGHRHIAEVALRRLGLDQVWLLVSPGNPLKDRAGMAPLQDRLASAGAIADGRRIVATDIERHFRSAFTLNAVRNLQRLFPRVHFVWLIGADNLVQLPRWRRWRDIARAVPFAVLPRPTYNHAALAGQAARWLGHARHGAREAPVLAFHKAPAWVFLDARQDTISATALRIVAAGEDRSPESPRHRPRQARPTPSASCPSRK